MTESERLIELLKEKQDYGVVFKESQMDDRFNYHQHIDNISIADYLLANGVIVPPCKVGDPAYIIYSDKDLGSYIDEFKITDVSTCQGLMDSIWVFDYDKIGKTVFLTREEAEQALKEREGE